jgi:hypothetical protein
MREVVGVGEGLKGRDREPYRKRGRVRAPGVRGEAEASQVKSKQPNSGDSDGNICESGSCGGTDNFLRAKFFLREREGQQGKH